MDSPMYAHHDPDPIWDLLKRPGKLAFDVGANLGQASKVLANHFDRVISFEPCRESYELLKQDAPPNVFPISMAVSDHNGFVELWEARQSIRMGQLVSKEGLEWGELKTKREVPCLTLNTLAQLLGTPDLVKIDVEGHEVEVVKGGLDVLEDQSLVIEIHHVSSAGLIKGLLPKYRFEEWHWDESVTPFIRENHFWLYSVN